MNIELHHLKYFVAVAENLSFTKAAVVLRVAQPSLTRQIRKLESEVGLVLIERSRSRIALTPEGKAMLTMAKQTLELVQQGVEGIRTLHRNKAGALRIAYCNGFHCSMIYEPLAVFQRESGVQIRLWNMSPAEQLKEIEAGHIDLGMIGFQPPAATVEDQPNLAFQCVAKHPAMVAVASKHPLARRTRIGLEDLQSEFFGVLSEKTDPGFRDWLNAVCRSANFTPKIIQEIDGDSGLMAFVAAGLGVTLVRGILPVVRVPGLTFRKLVPATLVEYCIAWSRKSESKALVKFIETLKRLPAGG